MDQTGAGNNGESFRCPMAGKLESPQLGRSVRRLAASKDSHGKGH